MCTLRLHWLAWVDSYRWQVSREQAGTGVQWSVASTGSMGDHTHHQLSVLTYIFTFFMQKQSKVGDITDQWHWVRAQWDTTNKSTCSSLLDESWRISLKQHVLLEEILFQHSTSLHMWRLWAMCGGDHFRFLASLTCHHQHHLSSVFSSLLSTL